MIHQNTMKRIRALRLPAVRDEQHRVARWLTTRSGRKWSREHFSDRATECHEIVEIVNDCTPIQVADHSYSSSDWQFGIMRSAHKEWADLTWTPDIPPEYASAGRRGAAVGS